MFNSTSPSQDGSLQQLSVDGANGSSSGPNKNNIKLISEVSSFHDDDGFGRRTDDERAISPPPESTFPPRLLLPPSIGRAVVASDNDVSNGFVKDGKMLPYVFEANDAGKQLLILFFNLKLTISFRCRSSKTIFQNSAGLRSMWQEVCLCYHDEKAFSHSHGGKTILM